MTKRTVALVKFAPPAPSGARFDRPVLVSDFAAKELGLAQRKSGEWPWWIAQERHAAAMAIYDGWNLRRLSQIKIDTIKDYDPSEHSWAYGALYHHLAPPRGKYRDDDSRALFCPLKEYDLYCEADIIAATSHISEKVVELKSRAAVLEKLLGDQGVDRSKSWAEHFVKRNADAMTVLAGRDPKVLNQIWDPMCSPVATAYEVTRALAEAERERARVAQREHEIEALLAREALAVQVRKTIQAMTPPLKSAITERQADFLASLWVKAGKTADDFAKAYEGVKLTKSKASEIIDQCL